jgi:hypothetical protein
MTAFDKIALASSGRGEAPVTAQVMMTFRCFAGAAAMTGSFP